MTQIQAYEDMSKEFPDEPEYGRAWRKHASLYGYHDQHTFAAGWNAAKDDMLSAAIESAQSVVANAQLTACSCPSGNGSLRWPCPVHPPESVKSLNQQVAVLPKDEWIKRCARRFMVRAHTTKKIALEMAESCYGNMGDDYIPPKDAADEEMSYWTD